jgi:hypothetical protein
MHLLEAVSDHPEFYDEIASIALPAAAFSAAGL